TTEGRVNLMVGGGTDATDGVNNSKRLTATQRTSARNFVGTVSPLVVAAVPIPESDMHVEAPQPLEQSEVAWPFVTEAATEQWMQFADPNQVSAPLANIDIHVEDLPGNYLAWTLS